MNDKEKLLLDNEKLVYRAINDLKYIPPKAEIEDLEQVGRIALWKAINSYNQDDNYALSTHCYRTIYGDVVNWLEKLQAVKRKDVYIDRSDTYYDSFEDEVIGDMLINEMKKYVSEKDVNMFIDKYVNGLTYKALAEKYPVSERTIKRRVRNTKDILKSKLNWSEETYEHYGHR